MTSLTKFLLLIIATAISAEQLLVPNPSFEENELAPGDFQTSVESWDLRGAGAGIFAPTASSFNGLVEDALPVPADGHNVAYCLPGSFISQIFGELENRATYNARVAVAMRTDSIPFPNRAILRAYEAPSLRQLAQAEITVDELTSGEFSTLELDFTYNQQDGAPQRLVIEMSVQGPPRSQAFFDSVRVDKTAPSPTTPQPTTTLAPTTMPPTTSMASTTTRPLPGVDVPLANPSFEVDQINVFNQFAAGWTISGTGGCFRPSESSFPVPLPPPSQGQQILYLKPGSSASQATSTRAKTGDIFSVHIAVGHRRDIAAGRLLISLIAQPSGLVLGSMEVRPEDLGEPGSFTPVSLEVPIAEFANDQFIEVHLTARPGRAQQVVVDNVQLRRIAVVPTTTTVITTTTADPYVPVQVPNMGFEMPHVDIFGFEAEDWNLTPQMAGVYRPQGVDNQVLFLRPGAKARTMLGEFGPGDMIVVSVMVGRRPNFVPTGASLKLLSGDKELKSASLSPAEIIAVPLGDMIKLEVRWSVQENPVAVDVEIMSEDDRAPRRQTLFDNVMAKYIPGQGPSTTTPAPTSTQASTAQPTTPQTPPPTTQAPTTLSTTTTEEETSPSSQPTSAETTTGMTPSQTSPTSPATTTETPKCMDPIKIPEQMVYVENHSFENDDLIEADPPFSNDVVGWVSVGAAGVVRPPPQAASIPFMPPGQGFQAAYVKLNGRIYQNLDYRLYAGDVVKASVAVAKRLDLPFPETAVLRLLAIPAEGAPVQLAENSLAQADLSKDPPFKSLMIDYRVEPTNEYLGWRLRVELAVTAGNSPSGAQSLFDAVKVKIGADPQANFLFNSGFDETEFEGSGEFSMQVSDWVSGGASGVFRARGLVRAYEPFCEPANGDNVLFLRADSYVMQRIRTFVPTQDRELVTYFSVGWRDDFRSVPDTVVEIIAGQEGPSVASMRVTQDDLVKGSFRDFKLSATDLSGVNDEPLFIKIRAEGEQGQVNVDNIRMFSAMAHENEM